MNTFVICLTAISAQSTKKPDSNGTIIALINLFEFYFILMPAAVMHDSHLLLLIQARKRLGAEMLYDQYAKVLSLVIFRIIRERDKTNEILEKTICQIWNSIDQYNEQDLSLLTWMVSIAKALANKFMKGKEFAISA